MWLFEPSPHSLCELSTKDKPNLKSNEPGQTHNETDGPTGGGFVDSEPAVQLINDLRASWIFRSGLVKLALLKTFDNGYPYFIDKHPGINTALLNNHFILAVI